MSAPSKRWSRQDYERAAKEYHDSLPLEHVVEAVQQATQRRIFLAALEVLRIWRMEVYFFNELLVQYFFEGNLRQVVPDNMVVLGTLNANNWTSYILEDALPLFWVLEYVSKSSWPADYNEKRTRYERELHVPYYLLFDPDASPFVLTIYKHNGTAYD